MILIRASIIKQWLKIIGRNQSWLARHLGVSDSFVSQVLSNKCKIPPLIIEKFLILGFKFEEIFTYDGNIDDREFYGKEIWFNEKLFNSEEYKRII